MPGHSRASLPPGGGVGKTRAEPEVAPVGGMAAPPSAPAGLAAADSPSRRE
ncbi:MAG: hypothetical protein OXU61_11410 [Gammaproteobacteria bacterium]|nr:hypothetical protein [Gammaproteobacteria bacterium]